MLGFGKPNVEKMNEKKDVKGLIKALGYKKDWQTRMLAAQALRKMGDQCAVDPLIKALNDYNSGVRRAAAEALCIGDKRAIEPLIRALSDSDRDVRKEAAWALSMIGDKRAVKPLIKALNDSDYDVCQSAARALKEIGACDVETLIIALNDSRSYVRYHVAEALGKIGDLRSVEPLIIALNDSDSMVRYHVAEALGKIRDLRSVEPLIIALNDSDRTVRYHVAEALGEIGDQRAIEPLIKALNDSEYYVHTHAVNALVKIGIPAVEPLFKVLSYSNDDSICSSAAEALDKITIENDNWYVGIKVSTRVICQLITQLKHNYKYVRYPAARILIQAYKKGNIDQESKEMILATRDLITSPHEDRHSDDVGSDCTYSYHTDSGIGLYFPI